MTILIRCNKSHKIDNLSSKINQHQGHQNLGGKPKLKKTIGGDNRKIHHVIEENKD